MSEWVRCADRPPVADIGCEWQGSAAIIRPGQRVFIPKVHFVLSQYNALTDERQYTWRTEWGAVDVADTESDIITHWHEFPALPED